MKNLNLHMDYSKPTLSGMDNRNFAIEQDTVVPAQQPNCRRVSNSWCAR